MSDSIVINCGKIMRVLPTLLVLGLAVNRSLPQIYYPGEESLEEGASLFKNHYFRRWGASIVL